MFRLAPMILIVALSTGCGRRHASISLGGEVSGSIRAGEVLTFVLDLAPGHVANVLVHQHEIDIAVESAGIICDSTEWDQESIYAACNANRPALINLIAATDGPRTGRYRLRFVSERVRSDKTELALRASNIETEGTKLLKKRTAESLPGAAEKLAAALDLWKQFGDLRREAHTLMSLGIAHERLGNYSTADKFYESALSKAKQVGDATALLAFQKTWMNLGGRFGEERAEIKALTEGLSRARQLGDGRIIAMYTKSLGSAYGKAHNDAEDERLKREYLGVAKKLGDPFMLSEALNSLGRFALRTSRYSDSLRYANESFRLAQEMGNEGQEIAALGHIATASGSLGDYEGEASSLEQIRDRHTKRGETGAWVSKTVDLGASRIKQGRPSDAWRYFSEAQDALKKIHLRAETTSERFVGPSETDFAIPLALLAERYPEYATKAFVSADSIRGLFLNEDVETRIEDLRLALGEDTSLVEFVAAPQLNVNEFLWFVTKDRIEALRTGNFQSTFGTIEAALLSLSNPKATFVDSHAFRTLLSKVYLAPLKGKLRTRKIVVVPDESMSRVPFALLPDPDYDDGSLLGDHHLITYASSGQAIAARPLESLTSGNETILLAGDPVTNLRDSRIRTKAAMTPRPDDWTATARAAGVLVEGSQLPRLAFATYETNAIAKELDYRKVTRLLGFDASRERVMRALQEADYAHLTAHGLADLQKPRASGLAFSFWDRGGVSQNGFMRFEEIANMKIHARLVTLSACDTSVGRVLSHYGVPTLSNAFLRAGARRVVSTLWKVDDAATAALMTYFYRNLFAKEKMLPGDALWRAQLEIRRQTRWSNPYYWAGFVLSGDWRPL